MGKHSCSLLLIVTHLCTLLPMGEQLCSPHLPWQHLIFQLLSRRTTLFPAIEQKSNWENSRPHQWYCSPNLKLHASYSHLFLFRLRKTSQWGPGHSDSMFQFKQKYIAVRIIGVQKLQPDIIDFISLALFLVSKLVNLNIFGVNLNIFGGQKT